MKTSKAGIALIKTAEGFRETAYWDVDGYSIGYGHHGATAGQRVSREEAERLLAEDLERVEAAVSRVNPRLNQNQFDACVSLAGVEGMASGWRQGEPGTGGPPREGMGTVLPHHSWQPDAGHCRRGSGRGGCLYNSIKLINKNQLLWQEKLEHGRP